MNILRILIAYYSKTGNTETISNAIREALAADFEVDIFKIEMVKKYSYFLPHLNPRIILDTILNRKPRIRSLEDMSSYDFICVGAPNWFGRTAPPVNTFIEEMINIKGKKAIAFVSSGLRRESYADDLKKRLERKGLKVLKTLSFTLQEISESQLREITEILTLEN
jgi:flavodoxin